MNAYVIQTSSLVQGIMVVEEGRIQRQIIYILSDYMYIHMIIMIAVNYIIKTFPLNKLFTHIYTLLAQ